jgi:molybdopterin-guanine dinucleotide biosynthesis protein A
MHGLAPLRAALLVGGESRRFGAPKQFARWGESTFGETVASALGAVAGEPIVVGDGPVPPGLESLRRVADAPGRRGPIAGLLGAFVAAPGAALLAAACDQPLLTPATLQWLVGRRRRGAIAVLARHGERGIEPLPGIYEPTARAVLEELAGAGGSLQPLAERGDVVVAMPPPELAAGWTSIDSEERRRELERSLDPGSASGTVDETAGDARPTIGRLPGGWTR